MAARRARALRVTTPAARHRCVSLVQVVGEKVDHSARASNATGEHGVGGFLLCVYGEMRLVVDSLSWATASHRVGLNRRQTAVSDSVRRTMQLGGPVVMGSSYPTPAQHQACFPRIEAAPHALLWRLLRAAPAARTPRDTCFGGVCSRPSANARGPPARCLGGATRPFGASARGAANVEMLGTPPACTR